MTNNNSASDNQTLESLFPALQNEATRKGLSSLLDKMAPLIQGGRLNNIVDLLSLASDGVDMLDDATIQRLMKVYEDGVSVAWLAGNTVRYASTITAASSPPSLLGLVKLARQDDVRRGLHFALLALSIFGKQMNNKIE